MIPQNNKALMLLSAHSINLKDYSIPVSRKAIKANGFESRKEHERKVVVEVI